MSLHIVIHMLWFLIASVQDFFQISKQLLILCMPPYADLTNICNQRLNKELVLAFANMYCAEQLLGLHGMTHAILRVIDLREIIS